MELVAELQDFFFLLEILKINTRGGSLRKSKYATSQKLNLGSGEFGNISKGLFVFLNLISNNLVCAPLVEFNEFQKNSLIPF